MGKPNLLDATAAAVVINLRRNIEIFMSSVEKTTLFLDFDVCWILALVFKGSEDCVQFLRC